MATTHATACDKATIGSVCYCQCAGVRHSIALTGVLEAPTGRPAVSDTAGGTPDSTSPDVAVSGTGSDATIADGNREINVGYNSGSLASELEWLAGNPPGDGPVDDNGIVDPYDLGGLVVGGTPDGRIRITDGTTSIDLSPDEAARLAAELTGSPPPATSPGSSPTPAPAPSGPRQPWTPPPSVGPDTRADGTLAGDEARASTPASLVREEGLTDEQREALVDYRSFGYDSINLWLRDRPQFDVDYPERGPEVSDRVGHIDAAMESSRLPADVELWRGTRHPRRMFGDALDGDLTGATWTEDAYLSTTTDPEIAGGFAGAGQSEPGVAMRITAPAGTGAVELSGPYYEAELLLERGLELRVTADHGVDESGTRVLDVEVVPADNGGADSETEGRPDIGALIDRNLLTSDLADEEAQRIRDEVGRAVNGRYAGLDVEVTDVGGSPDFLGADHVSVSVTIRDGDGNVVGSAQRVFYRDENGDLVAYHALLMLDPSVQGRGFATEFNGHMEEWYREQGVSRIQLDANIDVGGYSWAAHGYDFESPSGARRIERRLRSTADTYRANGNTTQADAAEAILGRMQTAEFGSPDYPTPYEISQVGRTDGADTWLGRDTMLGSYWTGVRWL